MPYGASARPSTHPDRLATIATLFGATPPPVAEASVLELGCARGGNLIPMAVAAPDAHFVGIDLSGRQVDDAREVASKLNLTNIDLRHASILDVDASYGEFDYIICHGVYAWVPRESLRGHHGRDRGTLTRQRRAPQRRRAGQSRRRR